MSDKDKGNNSLSINAQKEECVKFIGEKSAYRIYCDDGKSGKDIQRRPAFQEMMQNARDRIISRIVVKKYDRFSRNMREYLNITDELDRLGVSVYSLSEPFNTETKEGRMMRNNLLNFAEFERETIASRVADAVRIAYELYQKPETSLADIMKYFKEHNIDMACPLRVSSDKVGNLDRSHISRILESPLYVRADKEIYVYFSAKGYEMLDDVSDYDGVHGIFYHKTPDGTYIKLSYHEGFVDSKTWLAVQDKKSHNHKFPNNDKVMNSWVVGIMKFRNCGYAMHINHCTNKSGKIYRHFFNYGKTC